MRPEAPSLVPSLQSHPSTNLHVGQGGVSCRVREAELEAVSRHLHVGRDDEHHGALVHVPLGEPSSDVSSWQDRTGQDRKTGVQLNTVSIQEP